MSCRVAQGKGKEGATFQRRATGTWVRTNVRISYLFTPEFLSKVRIQRKPHKERHETKGKQKDPSEFGFVVFVHVSEVRGALRPMEFSKGGCVFGSQPTETFFFFVPLLFVSLYFLQSTHLYF